MSLVQKGYRLFIELSNRKLLSLFLKKFTTSGASRFLIPSFIKLYQINIQEMEKELEEYRTLHELFVRRLREGSREVDSAPDSVVSPVDSVAENGGGISRNLTVTVKGLTYSISEMVGGEEAAQKYEGGYYLILYLSPSHYHRIHSPVSGKVVSQWELGSRSYPVNKWGLRYGKHPLSKNYRVISEIKSGDNTVAVIKVGAMNINTIEWTADREEVKKGQELGYFSFGSTVVLLFEKDSFIPDGTLSLPKEVKVGERLGRMRKKQSAL